jgi:hypothetical protein
VSASGGASCQSSLYALCLPSLYIGITANCDVTVTPLLAGSGSSYVPAIWSSNPSGTYKQLVACPAAAGQAVQPGSSATPAQLRAAARTALENHIYGPAYVQALSDVTWASGTVSLTTVADSCLLKYAITDVSPSSSTYSTQLGADAVPAECDSQGTLLDGGECQLDLVGNSCAAGTQPVSLSSGGVACALCRAGGCLLGWCLHFGTVLPATGCAQVPPVCCGFAAGS